AVGAGKQLGGQHRTAPFLIFEERSLRRDFCAGVEEVAVALHTESRRQLQPTGREDRPRPHRDHHGIAFDDIAIDLDTGCWPSYCVIPVTRPRRNSAPCFSAARISSAVNCPGWTCAVVSGEPRAWPPAPSAASP